QEGGDTFSGESNHPPENPATKRSHRPMEKITQSARESSASGPVWETLEQYARGEIQQFVQRLLEEEVEELLGRAKSERRGPETPRGLRNGYGKGPDPSGHPLADQRSEAALVRRGALRDGAAIPADQELPAPRLADTGAAEQTRVHIHRGLTAVTPRGIACISTTFGTAPVVVPSASAGPTFTNVPPFGTVKGSFGGGGATFAPALIAASSACAPSSRQPFQMLVCPSFPINIFCWLHLSLEVVRHFMRRWTEVLSIWRDVNLSRSILVVCATLCRVGQLPPLTMAGVGKQASPIKIIIGTKFRPIAVGAPLSGRQSVMLVATPMK